MRFGELLDALHIGRRKEAKVGDKFDDYHVHAPPRRVATSSRADRRAGTGGESHRRLVLSPSGRSLRSGNAGTRSNHERSERTLSYGRMGTTGASAWKRTISAPRALSEIKSPAATTDRDVFVAERRKFYAPNERPQPRQRPNFHLPDTYQAYDGAEDVIAIANDGAENSNATASMPFDPFVNDQPPPSPEHHNNNGSGTRALPRKRSSNKSRRRPPPLAAPAFTSAGTRESDGAITMASSPRESDVALPVGPAVLPVQHGYVADAFREQSLPSDASIPGDTIGNGNSSNRPSSPTHGPEVSLPSPRKHSKKAKKRPPPLITSGVPHGFAAAGLREPPPNASAFEIDTMGITGPEVPTVPGGPGVPGLPRPSSAPDTSVGRAASPRNDASPPRVLPRRNSSKKKKKRPPALVTQGAPHGFASGGLRDPHVPLPNPALPRPNSAPDAYTPYLSPRAPSPSHLPMSKAPSLPTRNSSKRSKKRPPALVTHGSPHGFAAAGFREPTQHQQDTPIIVLSPPSQPPPAIPSASTSTSPETRQRKGGRGRAGLNPMNNNSNSNLSTVRSASSTGLILNKVRARNRIVSAQHSSSISASQNKKNPSHTSISIPLGNDGIARNGNNNSNGSPAAMLAKSNSRARLSYSSKKSQRSNSRNNSSNAISTSSASTTLHYTGPTAAASNPRALSDRHSPPKPLPMRPPQLESDLLFEEATSTSSFGDSETNRTREIFRDDKNQSGEVCEEDVFVIGADGVFKGGGFEISKNGMLKSPGNLTRKLSDGKMVDGVPHSSKHLIIVRSLAEFSRGSTLSSRRSNKVDSTIGAGAAGRVSLAVHRPSGRKIAVKRINVFDVQKRTQLLKELETLMCYDSRFLVRSYGAFYDGEGVVHVTLEYMDRGALSDVIELRGAISEDITVHITEHCLKGLEFLHKNHVLHRDFKTSNILMSRSVCRAKLSDFGLARELRAGESKINSFVGTLAYMSPERLNGETYTYASDVWGLGICVLECLLGHYPFPRPQSYFDYLEAAQSNPATLVKGASDECVDFIAQCTAADPRKRPTVNTLLQHPWITGSKRDTNTFRAWLQNIPLAHDGLDAKSYSKAVNGNGNSNKRRNVAGKRSKNRRIDEGLRKAKERAHDLDTHEGVRIGTRT